DLRPTEPSAAAEAAVRAVRDPLREHGFELTTEIDDEVPPVQGDPDALEQAALNLLGNAMKYSGDSSVIDLRVFRRDGHAVLEVEDRGIGIPPEERERIFEEFYRLGAEEQDVPGTGLGLTLVSHVAREHGGRVTVESEPGEGSTFGLWIPLEEESGGEESWEQKS
ncbi:MAG: ATP-binding protein, partial [Thermoanaerobaculia bacterium]|nr:ATP-binding protein [Thermoanaerobaculia bacterium]